LVINMARTKEITGPEVDARMLRERVVREWSATDQMVFEALVPDDHKLRRVAATIDFEAFREQLAEYYSPHMGRPGDPVMMVKVIFLQFFYSLSDAQIIERVKTDAAARWFLELGLEDKPPDDSTLSVFRSRLGVAGTQRVMDGLVRQCRQQGLLKYRLRLKDATHVVADVAVPATPTLVAEIRTRLLSAARPFVPDLVVAAEARLAEIRTTTEGRSDDVRLVPRVALLREILVWAHEVERPAGADQTAWTRFEQARALAHKIVGEAEDSELSNRTRSVHDPDARRGKHGEFFDGYLVDVLMDADSEIITAVNVLPANGAEGADAVTLVRHEESITGQDVAAMSIDGAGYDGKLLRELQDPNDLNMDVFVPCKESATPDKFAPADFSENAEHRTVTCPAGQISQYRQRDESRHATIYRFARATCANCPLRDRCLGRVPSGPFGRTVRKNDYEPEYQAVRAKVATPEYLAVKIEHPKIERKLSELVRRHGARRARYRGLLKVLCQQLWIATTVNIKRMVTIGSARLATTET
jgi:transposase